MRSPSCPLSIRLFWRSALPAVAVTVASLAPGCVELAPAAVPVTANAPMAVTTGRPERRDIDRVLTTVASLEPWQQATVFARTSGYLEELRVDRGDRLTKGQVLAVLAAPELVAQRARLGAERGEVQARIAQAAAELRLRDTTWKRLQAIEREAPGAASGQMQDEARGRLEVARTALETARTRLRTLQADVAQLDALWAFREVVAPFDGVVTRRQVDVGALVIAGTQGQATPILHIADDSRLRVVADLPEADALQAQVGHNAEILPEALPGLRVSGTISRRAETVDPGTRTMRVEVEVENADRKLTAGLSARLRLQLDARQDVVAVPSAWLRFKKEKPYVFVVDGGKARKVALRLGADDGKVAEVVEGLQGSEDVILSSVGSLSDGDAVEVRKATAQGAQQ